MKKTLVVLLALAMVFSLLAAFPFAAWADETDTVVIDDEWDGTANIAWYLNGPEEDGAYHIRSLEDLYGFTYLVNSYYSNYTSHYDGVDHFYKSCYTGVWYDKDTSVVLGFKTSGEDGDHMFDYAASGLRNPKPEGETVDGVLVSYTDNNGVYYPYFDYDVSLTESLDNSVYIDGYSFQGQTVVLDADLKLNDGNLATLSAADPANVNVWMPIGGGRNYYASAFSVFTGTFKGNGHTISGLYFNDVTASAVGFFGYVSRGTTTILQDFVLEDCYFNGGTFVGGVAGRLDGGVNAFNCHVRNAYIGARDSAGGFVGAVHGGTLMLQQCSMTGIEVEARYTVGAVVGGMNYQSLLAIDCLLQGSVRAYTETTGEGEDAQTIGGWDVGVVVGRIAQGSITVQRVISAVDVYQEAEDATATKAYSASCGLIYGALAKNGSTGNPSPMNSNPTVNKFYYVDLFHSTSGEMTPATGATKLPINQLQGQAPRATLSLKSADNEEGFDFSNPDTDYTGVWTCGARGELPYLTNMGKATNGTSDDSGDSGDTDEHNYVWVSGTAATCETAGTVGHYKCTDCEQIVDELGNELSSIVDPIKPHTFKEVAATDTMKAHYRCTVCGKYFDENKNEVKKSDLKIEETKKGCGSAIVSAPLIAVAIFGSALLMKKKENESK